MTDGERLVWATTFSIALDKGVDAVVAAVAAARAVDELRAAGQRKLSSGEFALAQPDARDLLDEIVSVP